MFGGPVMMRAVVRHVGQTRIFAGARPDGRQVLVYSMRVAARRPVAMILPLPVAPGAGEDALQFIDLKGYGGFFDDLDRVFPSPLIPETFTRSRGGGVALSAPRLRVHAVGDFEASFVPTRDDLGRLDPRFRLSDAVWDGLPRYADHGFAVFQLVDVARGPRWRRWLGLPDRKQIHPMAFSFPRRDPSSLFFPTVHVHDGRVRLRARFDHQLYAQLRPGEEPEGQAPRRDGDHRLADRIAPGPGWLASTEALSTSVDVDRAPGVIEPGQRGWKRTIYGLHPNEDVVLRPTRRVP